MFTLRPPPDMNLRKNKVLLALKLLYGIPESGLYRFLTYRDGQREKLQMNSSVVKSCILYRRSASEKYPDVSTLQMDDSLRSDSKQFLQEDGSASQTFKKKVPKILQAEQSSAFNGGEIAHVQPALYMCTKSDKISEFNFL